MKLNKTLAIFLVFTLVILYFAFYCAAISNQIDGKNEVVSLDPENAITNMSDDIQPINQSEVVSLDPDKFFTKYSPSITSEVVSLEVFLYIFIFVLLMVSLLFPGFIKSFKTRHSGIFLAAPGI